MAVASSPTHAFSKTRLPSVRVVEGLGVVGDVIGVELPVGPHHRLQMV